MIDLSIIVVNWNACAMLERCLQAIYATVQGPVFEVLVVDNASCDDSVSMVQQRFPQVKLIINAENTGFARASNQAMQACQGTHILLLNSDAFLTGKAVEQMTAFLDENGHAGIVGAHLVYPDGSPQDCYGSLPSLSNEIASLWGLDKHPLAKKTVPGQVEPVETGMVSGACLMLRHAILDQVGLLDEDFFFFNEEIDLCRRAQKAGWKVYYLPTAVTIHVRGGSTGKTAGRILLLYGGKLHYFNKHSGPWASRFFFLQIWIATLAKVLVYTLPHWQTPDRSDKNELWRTVLKGLPELQP